ncbi:tyrosine-type recombinase/integrase [Streptomyces cyaneofuscatus]|uniref:tyrosine-type recombinase/integrase n=1 Tax=Streptomyces cyaneofuscatus TaxID=66883 RepID=UPI00339EF950
MDFEQLRAACEARVEALGLPHRFSTRDLRDAVAEQRGRPIILRPLSSLGALDAPCGIRLETPDADLLFYEEATSPLHQNHILAHEISHIVCDHPGSLELDQDTLRAIGFDPTLVRRMSGRTGYTSEDEREAEMMASVIRQLMHSYLHRAPSLISVLLNAINEECAVELRHELMEGRAELPRVGAALPARGSHPPYIVVNGYDDEIEVATAYLRDLALNDCSPLTVRSYGYGVLRWFRLLWLLGMAWEKATEAEVAVLAGWLRTAANPQRRRAQPGKNVPGSVNLRTGKPALQAGYAPRTINHALSVVSGFYAFHAHQGHGPVVNPVPVSPQRRRALAHRSPLEPQVVVGRARMRQKISDRPPRSIPDRLWDELFERMGCERDRALLEFYVSSGARAVELLGVGVNDVDWAGQRIYVISKGSREREPIPASPQAFVRLARYLDEVGTPLAREPVWRTRCGVDRPLSYWAMRRIMQRANGLLGTNWTLHDLRHTAAFRMANGGKLTPVEVQTIMRHANIQTTSRYLVARIEEMADKLAEHYNAPRPETIYSSGYSAADIETVFGA